MRDRLTQSQTRLGHWVATHPSIVMAALMVAMLLTIAALRWRSSTEELRISVQTSTQAANETLTRVFANEHWDSVRPLLPAPGSDAQAVRDNPGIEGIDQIVRRFSRTTDVLKVKIYRLDGMTLYSSERAQIGEDRAANLGFQTAARGQTVSELTSRGRFGGFEGEMYDRDLVSSYVALRQQGRIEAVLEIYSDRTDSMALIGSQVRQLGVTLLPLLIGLLVIAVLSGALLHRMNARLTNRASARGRVEGRSAPAFVDLTASHFWAPGVQQPISAASRLLAAQRSHLIVGQRHPVVADAADIPSDRPMHALESLMNTVVNGCEALDALERLDRASRMPAQAESFETLSIDDLLQETVDAQARTAAAKGLSLSLYKYPPRLGEARADAASFGSLLHHLLGCAVDATTEGRIEIKATRMAGGIRVDVIDSSPGLAQARIDELCAAWDTGLLAAPEEAGLAGLRLVLCHAMARQLGGHAEFRSTPGHGSRLTVQTPLAGA